MPRSHAHLLAAVLTDAFREVVCVGHPAFLDAGSLTITAPQEPEEIEPPRPEIDLDMASR